MEEATIIRLAQYVVACVAIIAGAAVARAAVKDRPGNQWVPLLAGVGISLVFIYAAVLLATRRIYI